MKKQEEEDSMDGEDNMKFDGHGDTKAWTETKMENVTSFRTKLAELAVHG